MPEKIKCTIQLEVNDNTPIAIAQALIEFYMAESNIKIGLIKLQELAEHIEATVRGVSRSLEEGSR